MTIGPPSTNHSIYFSQILSCRQIYRFHGILYSSSDISDTSCSTNIKACTNMHLTRQCKYLNCILLGFQTYLYLPHCFIFNITDCRFLPPGSLFSCLVCAFIICVIFDMLSCFKLFASKLNQTERLNVLGKK